MSKNDGIVNRKGRTRSLPFGKKNTEQANKPSEHPQFDPHNYSANQFLRKQKRFTRKFLPQMFISLPLSESPVKMIPARSPFFTTTVVIRSMKVKSSASGRNLHANYKRRKIPILRRCSERKKKESKKVSTPMRSGSEMASESSSAARKSLSLLSEVRNAKIAFRYGSST